MHVCLARKYNDTLYNIKRWCVIAIVFNEIVIVVFS